MALAGIFQQMIGTTISHYRIEAQLGKGGMGVVYRAHDERLRRGVALKILPQEIASQGERRARILAEARAASALNHPGITTIYEVGEEGDLLFIVMELLTGVTLREKVLGGRMDSLDVVRLGAQVAEGLAAAHEHGVVHGDVKPENIVIQPDGRVKLLDFGIARTIVAETATLTRTATEVGWGSDPRIVGTLAYMAPEQMRGVPADARADLYSLGVVLYELACGHRPFPGPTAGALMGQTLSENPPALGAAAQGTPAELARIVHKLLEKKASSRHQTARELQAELTSLARDVERGTAGSTAITGKRAIAVLPFKLLTPNPEDDYLSVALADAVINQLSSSAELVVRPTSTVMRYAKQSVNPLAAACELNVQVVVDGSIQKFGPKLRVHVTAWNAADGSTLISGKHDSEMTDLFGLQDKIAESLARALGSAPAEEALAERPTQNAMAYELFLRATERLTRLNKWDTRTAIEMLESAAQLDARFADAWARLAGACVIMAGNFEPGPRWILQAEKAVRRALALDRDNADAQCARGRILWTPAKKFQNRAALRALGDALRLKPGHEDALIWRCLVMLHVGLLDEAREGLSSAVAAVPDNTFALTFLGQTLLYMGKYEEGQEYLARALAIDSASVWGNYFGPIGPLYSKRFDAAMDKIRSASSHIADDPILHSYEAVIWAVRGDKRKAQKKIQRALKGKSLFHTHHTWHHAAAAYAQLGRPAEATALLIKASKFGLPNYPAFRDDPFLAPLQNHPPFLRLMSGLKREWSAYQREFGRA
jgi:serine/threonine protein kinase/tetratricopeptide (TPR) repeat protein